MGYVPNCLTAATTAWACSSGVPGGIMLASRVNLPPPAPLKMSSLTVEAMRSTGPSSMRSGRMFRSRQTFFSSA